ncbi:hypothetical protein GCM10007901_01450 [Dyella acidisoli]|uniref:Uncharacterized protein n=2 Tax=Dyella acidisoli TaxID=1867834 RepID=A0ABQ5XHM3_9GAMM|nr:hypothetical protein GCM10007901_01450 [Dyella acidisoli]
MHLIRSCKLATLGLLCWTSVGLTQPPPQGSLCRPPEKTYYSCHTVNHKIMSLCGALPGALQYRFGTPGKIELQYPDKAADGTKLMRYAYYFRFQTNYSEVVFDHNGYSYTVFDYDENDYGERHSAGVRVAGSNGVEHEVKCKEPVDGDLVQPGKYLKCDPDNALNDDGNPDSCHR